MAVPAKIKVWRTNSSERKHSIIAAAADYWRDIASRKGRVAATWTLLAALWEFARDSTPWRLRQRYGDADYDWEYRVNTTSAAVGWRERLLGVFHSRYQPTDPALFREMLDAVAQHANPDRPDDAFHDFTFLDLGSGKGRTLLMAADYPFRRIIGVELLPALHAIAEENVRSYKSESQKCFAIESVCGDASAFALPEAPLVIYLFNPFPESGLRRMAGILEQSLKRNPRPVYVVYHNPLLEHVLAGGALSKVVGAHQYSIFAFTPT